MLKDRIYEVFYEIAGNYGVELVPLRGDTVLLECGLDSLAFAALVARLEEKLGYDPFVMTDEPIYPRTIDDFIGIYERFFSEHK
jgi:aryl carrier-like protein